MLISSVFEYVRELLQCTGLLFNLPAALETGMSCANVVRKPNCIACSTQSRSFNDTERFKYAFTILLLRICKKNNVGTNFYMNDSINSVNTHIIDSDIIL